MQVTDDIKIKEILAQNKVNLTKLEKRLSRYEGQYEDDPNNMSEFDKNNMVELRRKIKAWKIADSFKLTTNNKSLKENKVIADNRKRMRKWNIFQKPFMYMYYKLFKGGI